jgi:hypothetical protein
MPRPTSADSTLEPVSDRALDSKRAQEVADWVQLLARTQKTSRLYDGENPTVIRFRRELARNLALLLEDDESLTLRFTSNDVLHDDVSVYPARSREDNLAQPFHLSGIRTITFLSGIEPSEVESFLDQLLRAGKPLSTDEDLVTLLWEANLPHVEFDYLPTGGDIEGGGGEGHTERTGCPLPWPKEAPEGKVGGSARPADGADPAASASDRSDDWQTADRPTDVESAFAGLQETSSREVERFRAQFDAEQGRSTVQSALSVIGDSIAAQSTREDRVVLGQFLPRVLRESIRLGQWNEALEALQQLRSCEAPFWSVLHFTRELLEPNSIVMPHCVTVLDQQDSSAVSAFLSFARELGPDASEWLMTILAQSEQKLVRRPLTRVIAELCHERPERLKPWLANAEWYVVRNVVHIFGWIGGPKVVGLIREVVNHPEPRVRREVVAVLSQAERAAARPILLKMLDNADGDLFAAILYQLSMEPDVHVSERLLRDLLDPGFEKRPAVARRAICTALASCGGAEILPKLEAQLFGGGWFQPSAGRRREALARCVAQIGGPEAIAILERGAKSWRLGLRKACEAALEGARDDD